MLNANLSRGISGQDVFNLQTLLIEENLLSISQPTGYFGNLTFAAVVAFQNRYASNILTPLGLANGTGYVGAATRAKLNDLYGCGTQPTCVPNWTCGWSPCTNGTQIEGPVDSNNCGISTSNAGIACPDLARTCTTPTNQSPVISGISGPTTLNAGQNGTWTINASDPENGTLSYSVIWGDEAVAIPMTMNSANSISYTQTTIFTHSYSNAGTYTPTFYVRNNTGNTVSSSTSVNVGNSNSIQPTINYLQPNSGTIDASVTIIGSGFTPTGNRIKFGNLGIENNPSYSLNSYDGKTIVFTVPSSNYFTCLAYGCMIAQQLTQPGNYEVSVTNGNGTSNQVPFTVTSSNPCIPNWECTWGPCNNGSQSEIAVDSNSCGIAESGQIACPMIARVCN